MESAERMMALFAGFATAHGTHGEPRRAPDSLKWEIKSTARTLREPVTLELWKLHLRGERPLGIITIREDGLCKWGSLDYDVYDADLLELIERVRRFKLPLVPVRSKSGGLHLFLFLKDWTPAAVVQAALRDMAALLGIAGCEVYPKQTAVLTERGDLGNWIIVPYFGGTYGDKLLPQVGLKDSGAEMTLTEFLSAAEGAALDEAALTAAAAATARGPRRAAAGKRQRPRASEPDAPFADGPVCLEILVAQGGIAQGYRNNALLMMGIYYKMADADGWRDRLEEASKLYLDPPGTAEGVIRQLEKKDYRYTCKTEPMCGHCNARLCRTRQFGIGEENEYPSLSGLRILHSDPPVYFLDVNGKRIELSEDQLFTYSAFQKRCIRENKMFANMKQADWVVALRPHVENMEALELPEEGTKTGSFRELLEEYCTNRQRGERMEDLFVGRPYKSEEDGRYYFRIRHLMAYLKREGAEYTLGQVATMVRDMKGDAKYFNIKGRGLRAWYVPSDKLEETPELDTPERRESKI